MTNFRLKEAANKIVEQFKNNLAEKKMSVHLDFPDDYTLTADYSLMTRVLTNLFDNAIRYSQGTNIGLIADEKQIVLADNGVGIPVNHLQDIFERFFRLDKSRNRQTGGSGLGLSIVREIVEAHGWKIKARIPEDKKGVEFMIDLK